MAGLCRCRTGAAPRRTVVSRWLSSWPGLAGGCGLWRCLCRSSDGRSDTLERPGLVSSIRAQASQPITEGGGRRAEARLHVLVPVGVQPSAGTGEGAGRRGTSGRNTRGGASLPQRRYLSDGVLLHNQCIRPFLHFRAYGYQRAVAYSVNMQPRPRLSARPSSVIMCFTLGRTSPQSNAMRCGDRSRCAGQSPATTARTPPGTQSATLSNASADIAFLSAPDLTAPVSSSIPLPHPFICARFTRESLLARTVDDQGAGRAGDGVVISRKADL